MKTSRLNVTCDFAVGFSWRLPVDVDDSWVSFFTDHSHIFRCWAGNYKHTWNMTGMVFLLSLTMLNMWRLTGLECGGVCRHAPRAAPAALGHHHRELIECVCFQTRHRVEQGRRVCHLIKKIHELLNYERNTTWASVVVAFHFISKCRVLLTVTLGGAPHTHYNLLEIYIYMTFHLSSSDLILGVGRDVGLPSDGVISGVGDLLVLGERVVGPADFDGVVTEDRRLNAHRGQHGCGVRCWGVWVIKKFIKINVWVYGVWDESNTRPNTQQQIYIRMSGVKPEEMKWWGSVKKNERETQREIIRIPQICKNNSSESRVRDKWRCVVYFYMKLISGSLVMWKVNVCVEFLWQTLKPKETELTAQRGSR